MAKKPIEVTTLTHGEATRVNIPTAECESVMAAAKKTRSSSLTSCAIATSMKVFRAE